MFRYTEFTGNPVTATAHFKDERLDELARQGNVAQFVSFSPFLTPRFNRVVGFEPNHKFPSVMEAISALFATSPEAKVNVRSFDPAIPQGHEFIYGIDSVAAAESHLIRLATSGLHVIVNETINVNDGGVSGVSHAGIVEFAPGETPRVVERGDILSVPRDLGFAILQSVYGFAPDLPADPHLRIEFSVHPIARGFNQTRTVLWESQHDPTPLNPYLHWPNRFSKHIGDKAFGLLLAHCLGWKVPFTTVIARKVPPFSFGTHTGSSGKWTRTCPEIAEPGHFPTIRGWVDPFELMKSTADSERIASVLLQEEVESQFSGALLSSADGAVIIEGVHGFADDFMLGKSRPETLSESLRASLGKLHSQLEVTIGSVRVEWAMDASSIWILQLQQEAAISSGLIIVPGDVDEELSFTVSDGVSGLREFVQLVRGRRVGIRLIGNVGMTSHIADILRRERIPSRIVSS